MTEPKPITEELLHSWEHTAGIVCDAVPGKRDGDSLGAAVLRLTAEIRRLRAELETLQAEHDVWVVSQRIVHESERARAEEREADLQLVERLLHEEKYSGVDPAFPRASGAVAALERCVRQLRARGQECEG